MLKHNKYVYTIKQYLLLCNFPDALEIDNQKIANFSISLYIISNSWGMLSNDLGFRDVPALIPNTCDYVTQKYLLDRIKIRYFKTGRLS